MLKGKSQRSNTRFSFKLREGKSQDGFVALVSTIIISAVTLLLIAGAFTISVIEIEKSDARFGSETARAWVNFCAEEALQEIRDNSEYTGSEEFEEEADYGCFFIVSGDFPQKIVQSMGFYSDYTKRIEIKVSDYNPLLVIDSWEEVTEF